MTTSDPAFKTVCNPRRTLVEFVELCSQLDEAIDFSTDFIDPRCLQNIGDLLSEVS